MSLQTIKAGEGVEKREPSCTVGGNVNWYSHYGRQYDYKGIAWGSFGGDGTVSSLWYKLHMSVHVWKFIELYI